MMVDCDVCKNGGKFPDGPSGSLVRMCRRCSIKLRADMYTQPDKSFWNKITDTPDNSHYKVGAIDPCQYVEAMGTAEFRGACVLNILKYITRYPYKGTPLEDLAKAQDYLNKLIEHEKEKTNG